MRILFVNQYFPPDPAPTGILFREIADECSRRGDEVDFVDAGGSYRSGQNQRGRMFRELAALRRIVATGKARARADVVVSGTSPPCLAVFADRIARAHRARHVHWVMDVYPEIAIALGEVRANSLVARITGWMMTRAYRRCAAVIALDEDMAAILKRHRIEPICIRPWVFASVADQLQHFRSLPSAGPRPWTWLYSGNLGRAHEFETLLEAQKIIESREIAIQLVFQGGGASWQNAQDRVRELGLTRCHFRGYAPEGQLVASLMESDALVVTQRTETKGLLWPSKLGLVTALPRPSLFVGPMNGAIARSLHSLAHVEAYAPGEIQPIADWVINQSKSKSMSTVISTVNPVTHRADALEAMVTAIRG